MPDTKTQTVQGRVLSYADGFGQGKLLTIQREPASRWEANNEERLILALDVPPWVAKDFTTPPSIGEWIAVDYRLLGREYGGRRYLSAQVSGIQSMGEQMAPQTVESAVSPASPDAGTTPDDDMPF